MPEMHMITRTTFTEIYLAVILKKGKRSCNGQIVKLGCEKLIHRPSLAKRCVALEFNSEVRTMDRGLQEVSSTNSYL